LEILRGRGGLKGVGVQTKKISVGEGSMDIFWNNTF